jgi:hypothetical protein
VFSLRSPLIGHGTSAKTGQPDFCVSLQSIGKYLQTEQAAQPFTCRNAQFIRTLQHPITRRKLQDHINSTVGFSAQKLLFQSYPNPTIRTENHAHNLISQHRFAGKTVRPRRYCQPEKPQKKRGVPP